MHMCEDTDHSVHTHSTIRVLAGQSVRTRIESIIRRTAKTLISLHGGRSLRWMRMQSCRKCCSPAFTITLQMVAVLHKC